MKIKILRGIEITVAGQPVGSLQPRHRRLLVPLVEAAGQRVSSEDLFGWLWPDGKPADPDDQLHHCAYQLRAQLAKAAPDIEDPLPSDNHGYRLRIDGHESDLHVFRSLADQADGCAETDPVRAGRLGRTALAEWGSYTPALRGPEALAGLRGPRSEQLRETLRSEHRDVLLTCLDAELRQQVTPRLLRELATLARADETGSDDEELTRLHILARLLSGHQSTALRLYREFRDRMADRGVEPGPELRLLYQRIQHQVSTADLSNGAPTMTTDEKKSAADESERERAQDPGSAATDAGQPGADAAEAAQQPNPPTVSTTHNSVNNTFHGPVDMPGSVLGFAIKED